MPWIGKDYQNGGAFKKRLLVLGESVYCGDQCSPCVGCPNFTITCIEKYIHNDINNQDKWAKTYNKFESAIMGYKIPIQDREKIWNSFSLHTFFQKALNNPREDLGDMDYDMANDCLMKILRQLRPQGVLVWGMRLWGSMTDEHWTGTDPISNEYVSPTGFYTIDNTKIPFMAIFHPSVGFSWDKWHKNIKQFIEKI